MPTRAELLESIRRLRHAPTARAPIDLMEQVQHTIVRLEALLSSPTPPAPSPEAERLYAEALRLIEQCAAIVRR